MASFRFVVAFAVFFAGTFGFAQQSASPEKHSLTGSVVNAATGEPLRKALVSVQAPDGQRAAFSDAAGHFSIDNLTDGQYVVSCQKPGFFGSGQSPAGGLPSSEVVMVSSAGEPVTLKLLPAASIVGRVVDEQGQPVEGANLQLSRSAVENGLKTWSQQPGTTTDEDGNYELGNLQPGTYRLFMSMHPAPPFAAASTQTAAATARNEVFPGQYYPAGSDSSAAQPLILTAGQIEHADFTVKAVVGFRIRGSVSPFRPDAFIVLQDADGNNTGFGVGINPRTGRFVTPPVPPGSWKIVGQSFSQNQQLRGEQDISIADADVANVQLQLQPHATIPVHILNAPEGSIPNLDLQLIGEGRDLEQQNVAMRLPQPNAAPDGGESPLQFSNILPGRYRLQARTFDYGSGFCIDSVRSGSGDVMREGLTVASGGTQAPVEVSLRSDCAKIQVKLNAPAIGKPAALVLLADNPILAPIMISTSGGVELGALPPGTYRLYAFDNADNLEYRNPEAMRSFTAKEVTLAPNQSEEVTLDVFKTAN